MEEGGAQSEEGEAGVRVGEGMGVEVEGEGPAAEPPVPAAAAAVVEARRETPAVTLRKWVPATGGGGAVGVPREGGDGAARATHGAAVAEPAGRRRRGKLSFLSCLRP